MVSTNSFESKNCPECGKAMTPVKRIDISRLDKQNPLGVLMHRWHCRDCNYKTPETEGDLSKEIFLHYLRNMHS